ncbi:hypothetical protein V7S43_012492 [Phytophthora oleae]|uniref:Pericentrin/AKAP-450 centrosomal targeting domain-containing protein n=1 Tax=Phytophthora oleae TaxID=2107226 RepID=A0ABD3F9H9_9STRA
MNSSELASASDKLDVDEVESKSIRIRLPSLPVLEDDSDSFIYDDDGESSDGDGELCLYIRRLETDKQELENEVRVMRDHDASQQIKLQTTQRRVEMLEASLKDALNAGDAFRHEKDVVLTLQASERERMATLVALLEEAQNRYEDAERARQSAIFKLSALQASRADVTSQNLLPSAPTSPRGQVDSERIEKYKRDIELLRQKLELTEEQTAERQKMAVSLALHEAQLDYSNMVEHLKLECERRLNEWRHQEAVRAKERESAVDEDRYSIRLEMKHALQRSQIDQRVAFLQAQAQFTTGSPRHVESDFSTGTLDEVLVRMQLDQIRTRRFEALKKTLLIRRAKLNQAAKELFSRWKIQASNSRILRLNAVLHMHRVALHLDSRKKLRYFNQWRGQVRQLQAQTFQAQALSCWNRMIAVERISHVIEQTSVKRTASYFHRWRQLTFVPSENASTGTSSNSKVDEEAMQALQQEITKLHDQLSSSKSEAWRYKRQLLKQFL